MSNSNNSDIVTNTGVDIFYHIVAQMTEINLKFLPTNEFCSQTLAELGVSNYNLRIYDKVNTLIFRYSYKTTKKKRVSRYWN